MKRALLITKTLLGTDAIVPLDGRWNADTIYLACYTHASDIKHLHPSNEFLGYEVYNSTQRLTDKPAKTVMFIQPL